MSRNLCPQCHKPLRACLCDLAIPLQTAVEVVIWQHPSETAHPKNSATLLQLSVDSVRTLITEQCSAESFYDWCGDDGKTNLLLSPMSEAAPILKTTPGLEHDGVALDNLRLIVIDGTWRKARKICHLNDWLQRLPTLTLNTDHQPLYQMRKAEKTGQFSTLEAVCLGLAQLEDNPRKYQPLLQSFVELNRRWDSFRN